MANNPTPTPAQLRRRELTQHRDVLVSLRDFFVASRVAGPRNCEGSIDMFTDGVNEDSISDLREFFERASERADPDACRHQELLNESEHNHGDFVGDGQRIAALDDAIRRVSDELLALDAPPDPKGVCLEEELTRA